ncbi:vitamin K epoxide reductase family protein [Microbacterium sp. H1-D42]|uniref:vitamin K epoxide reductase family protein n=1 Tax=Microbacterium sp. H1-D42 TaxID=2925844 RepID=UPI001F52EF04|nr:vitamin K epoxide reductase family protein [Microbacterium sp. H1-D42]UNK71457.1 vitamin K epoxide reductase family protein [Microbacterium sp. H1-D42]
MSTEISAPASDLRAFRPGAGTAWFWIAAGVIAWIVSFLLYLEYIGQLTEADAIVSCDINPIVTCGPNLLAPAGNLLGFTNAVIGLVVFAGPVLAGVSALAAPGGMRAWYWRVYALAVLGGYALVSMFAYRSIFEFGSLCPWCMVVWLMTIPLFWSVAAWTLRVGVWGPGLRHAGRFLGRWLVLIVVANYAIILVAAQLRLDLLGAFF